MEDDLIIHIVTSLASVYVVNHRRSDLNRLAYIHYEPCFITFIRSTIILTYVRAKNNKRIVRNKIHAIPVTSFVVNYDNTDRA